MENKVESTTIRKDLVATMSDRYEDMAKLMVEFHNQYIYLTDQEKLLVGGFVFSGMCPEKKINLNIVECPKTGVPFFIKRIDEILEEEGLKE